MNKILCCEILDKESRVLGYELPFVSLKNDDYMCFCVWLGAHAKVQSGGLTTTSESWFSPSTITSFVD